MHHLHLAWKSFHLNIQVHCFSVLISSQQQNIIQPSSLQVYNNDRPPPVTCPKHLSVHISSSILEIQVFSKTIQMFSTAFLSFSEPSPESPLTFLFLPTIFSRQSSLFLLSASELFQPLPATQPPSHFCSFRCLLQQHSTSWDQNPLVS